MRRESDPRAEEILTRYSQTFGTPDGAEVPVDAIATDLLGLRVLEYENLGVSGLLLPSTMHIYLDAQEAREVVERRRFTLAHEIGHWVCHCGEGRTSSHESIHCRPADPAASAEPSLEHEANNFAASLLMPEGAVRRAANRGLDVPEAASHFMVSEIAMEWRFFNLEITDEPPAS